MAVQTLRARLNRADIDRLVNQKDAEARALAARKFCARFADGDLSGEERRVGGEVLRILAMDAAELVRRALAVTLQRSPYLPADVARKMIDDVDTIAVPIIAGSPVLEDEDLIRLATAAPENRQVALASRAQISEAVVEALVEHGAPAAVRTAAGNDGARFSARAYAGCFTRFENDESVLDGFVERRELPLEVTEKLISHISDAALQRLVHRHALPAQLAVELAEGARERATVDLVDQAGLSADPRRFAQQLQLNARLTPSLMLRALFRGHMTVFEHCIAELAEIDHAKAWLLIHDAGPLGLEAVFKRAGLPDRVLPAVRAAIQAWHTLEIGPGGDRDIVRFRKRLAERIFTQFQGAPENELTYIMDRLDIDERLLSGRQAAGAA
ncbi:MAG: DUF2336 domain-containing protein [Oceanicaulis sp.]